MLYESVELQQRSRGNKMTDNPTILFVFVEMNLQTNRPITNCNFIIIAG